MCGRRGEAIGATCMYEQEEEERCGGAGGEGRDGRRKEVAAARTDEYENGGKAAKAIGL